MQVGWRLERTYLAGAGYPESRLEGLDIHWSDPFESSGHAALWADNGTGKSTITSLRFALYLPIPGSSSGATPTGHCRNWFPQDACATSWSRPPGWRTANCSGSSPEWSRAGRRDGTTLETLKRHFYGWVTGPDGPTISELPFQTAAGRWATSAQYTDAIRELIPRGGALPPHPPSDHQDQWGTWLTAADVDLTQMRFQAAMNASEGGVEHVMRFTDSDDFVRWLIGTITPTSTVEQIGSSIEVLRKNAAGPPPVVGGTCALGTGDRPDAGTGDRAEQVQAGEGARSRPHEQTPRQRSPTRTLRRACSPSRRTRQLAGMSTMNSAARTRA